MPVGGGESKLLALFSKTLSNLSRAIFSHLISDHFHFFSRYARFLVQFLSHVWLFATSWTAARQASLFFTISQSLTKLMSIELVLPFSHLILGCPHLLLLSIFPSIRVLSNESAFYIRWPKYWSFSFSIRSSNEYSFTPSSPLSLSLCTCCFYFLKFSLVCIS